jgi:drug/metabolite transporter (DMT)-like permease
MALGILLVYATVSALGLALLKLAMSPRDGLTRPWTDCLGQPVFWLGALAYGCGFLLWLWLLRRYPLSIVFPVAAGAIFIMSCLLDILVFRSPVSARTLLGGLLIVGGIAVTGWDR